ncbi:DUF6894 family protein [Microvirga sp. G4-2]|uniref:DUF6894 family protein n=1 Tax=Microvirga sp. G4-2 TaxID=3434467 RepID=UPI004044C8BC
MPRYRFFVSSQQDRVRYPRSFDLADADAAKDIALQIARVFTEVVPYWGDLSADQRNGFMIEIVDEADEVVLTIPLEVQDSKT